MGIGNAFVGDLAELKQREALDGISRVIEIGAQQLSNLLLRETAPTDELFRLYGRSPPDFGSSNFQGLVNGLEHQPENAPASRAFWESLGFQYAALDFDGHRDSIAIDLNRDAVPKSLKGAFDLVVNAGTTEHVANQDNAFRVIHDLVRPGGIMIHELPAQGMMMHGLINYNPKFFWHLCRENSYDVLFLKVCSYTTNPVPQNVLDSNIQFSGHQHISIEEIPDFSIRAALRKKLDQQFVTPLDIPPITKTKQPASLIKKLRNYFAATLDR
jgi:SAM-dependent methyltransferase